MMTSQTGSRIKRSRHEGFTLIELMLVMAILIVVLSVSSVSLTSFFKGRALDSESRRFVSLTRHAQSRAVGEGLPMTLWINVTERKYGLEIEPGHVEEDEKAAEYELNRDLEIEVAQPVQGALTQLMPRPIPQRGNERIFRFGPDGALDETNPEYVALKTKDGEVVVIAPNRNRLNYEVSTNTIYRSR